MASATETDPFSDRTHSPPEATAALPLGPLMSADLSLPSARSDSHGLQLSLAGQPEQTTSFLGPNQYNTSLHGAVRSVSSASFRTASSNTNISTDRAGMLSPLNTYDRASYTSSPASAFSWMDASSPATDRRSMTLSSTATPGTFAHPDDFVHLHEDELESEHAFSIGSYDDLTTGSSTHGQGQTPQDRSDAGSDDDDEPMSPPHNSEQGSPGMHSSSSSDDWESVGSPSSDGRRRLG